ncbi:MAG TPA: ribosome small subunit-dependent GTPase A [Blastocatellia bacterium]|nr:ribosome small subunit-dependent GTPase A [Blastocatellia bacterium]
MYDLKSLGWSEFFDSMFKPYRELGHFAGRVALEERGAYRLLTGEGELSARVRGKLRFDSESAADFPAVGDWVSVARRERDGLAQIHAVLPRRSKFSRKAAGGSSDEQVVAANVDTVFIVQGLDHDFNLRRLERYLVAAFESGAAPVVILSKADLCEDVENKRSEAESVAPGTPVHAISSISGQGLDELDQYVLPGTTVAFLGSSGAGKSTLINRIVGEEIQKTAAVREHDSRGRHTTTHRELIVLETGGLLIDTPGMRELQLWDASGSLGEAFSDVQSIAAACYFSDCGHQNEPGCAVREALEDGSLDRGRYESYAKMEKEIEYLDSRMDTKLHLKRKSREKKIHRAIRSIKNKRA